MHAIYYANDNSQYQTNSLPSARELSNVELVNGAGIPDWVFFKLLFLLKEKKRLYLL
jgi:hypothetical protein